MTDCYRILAKLAITLHTHHGDDPMERKAAIALIRNGIFDCKPIHSGLISKAAQHLKYNQITKEHFMSRSKSASKIFDMLDNHATFEEVLAFIIESSSVHFVTKRENIDLIPFQKNVVKYPTWQEQYAAAGIELVPYIKKTKKKYVYIIHGIEYNNLSEAAVKNNCTEADVYYRCVTSNSKKFFDWKVRKLDNEI